MTKPGTKIVSPFDWRHRTAGESVDVPVDAVRKPAGRVKKKMTMRERFDRILAPRWGNPYCKPGAV